MLRKNHKKSVVRASKLQDLATQENGGFTLIEMLVVVLIVGVLSAIAAPAWVNFVNRQRVNKANDAVLAAIQEAKRQAKKTKRYYSVSFQTNAQKQVLFAVYPRSGGIQNMQPLGGDVGMQSGQLLLGTNLTSENTASSSVFYNTSLQISFDDTGGLLNPTFGTAGLRVIVAIPNSSNPTQPSGLMRCVILQTLIGGIQTAKDATNCST